MLLLYSPCYCIRGFVVEGVEFIEGVVYLYECINSGVYLIDDVGGEDFGPNCFYEIMNLGGEQIGYLCELDFEENFSILEFEIREVNRLFNRIMDGSNAQK